MDVVIADDHGIIRQGLRNFLEKQEGIKVVGEAQNGLEAVQLAGLLMPDIIIMDITMPEMNGIVAASRVRKEHPDIKIIALSMHMEKHFILEMLAAGAHGYVPKTYCFDEVLRAIHGVAAEDYYISPAVTEIILDDYVKEETTNADLDETGLGDDELQFVRFLSEGKTTKQIALLLHISPKTADAKRRKIMKQLHIDSLADLTKFAICKGLTSAEY